MKEHLYQVFWDVRNYRIIDCQTCGFKHIHPIPSKAELAKYYEEKYYRDIKPFPYQLITEDYIEERINSSLSYDFYIDIYQKVMNFKKNNGLRMVDIGCGNDLLGKFFLEKGWMVDVVEPSLETGEYLRKFGLNVINKPVEDIIESELDSLSFVNIQFVLEHVRQPLEVLIKLHDLMLPGGIIRICVPNDFSEGQLAFMENFSENLRWVYLPDHINYFNFNSLSTLLGKAGFKEIYRITNFPLEFLLVSGINYYNNKDDQSKVGAIITNFEASFKKTQRTEILEKYYESLAQMGLGRSIFMYAIKDNQGA